MKSTTSTIQSTLYPTPELSRGPLFVWEHENKPYEEVATLRIQENLIQNAADNPYWFATLDECMSAISPFIFLPAEEEKYLISIVSALRDFQAKTYTYGKDSEWKNTIKPMYNITAMNEKIFDLLKWHPLLKKYKHYAYPMVRSWKSSKSIENARNNVREYLIKWAKERIWSQWWKQTHKQWLRDFSAHKTASVLSIPGRLDIHSDSEDLIKNPPRKNDLKSRNPKNKKFDKRSLTILFQQTWDAELDNLLHEWREYVEDAAFFKPALKPWQILLRRSMQDNDFSEPYMCEFKVLKPKYLQKHFPDTN